MGVATPIGSKYLFFHFWAAVIVGDFQVCVRYGRYAETASLYINFNLHFIFPFGIDFNYSQSVLHSQKLYLLLDFAFAKQLSAICSIHHIILDMSIDIYQYHSYAFM